MTHLALAVLAADDPSTLEAIIDKAGPIAGTFVLLLGGALFVLFRSMNKQMKRIDQNLPMGPQDERRAEDRALTESAIEEGEKSG
jgi:hypothetical protein